MTETIARLRITLSDTNPEIWRVIDVPVEASLKMVHGIIQAAMGWVAAIANRRAAGQAAYATRLNS